MLDSLNNQTHALEIAVLSAIKHQHAMVNSAVSKNA
jgi:hypothetical protein